MHALWIGFAMRVLRSAQAATPSSLRVRWMNSRTAGSRRRGGEGGVELAYVVLGTGGLDAGEDVDGAVAEFEAVIEVAGLEVGGCDDGEAHADGAGEGAGRHGGGSSVPSEGGLGVLQIPEDLGGVRGQAGVRVEVDPRGLVTAVGLRLTQQVLGRGEGSRGGPGVVFAGVSAGLDQFGERQHPRCGLALGAVEGALGHVDGFGGEAAHQGLHGHGGEYVAAELYVAAGAGEAQGLDEVPLGGFVLADIERRPSGKP